MIKSATLFISISFFSSIALAQFQSSGSSGEASGPGGAKVYIPPPSFDGSDAQDKLDKYRRDVADKLHQSRPKFARLFERTQNAFLKDDMKKADQLVVELRELKPSNDYEQSRLHLVDYWYYGKHGNKELEYEAASKMLALGAENIDSHAYVEAGMRLLKYQYNNQDFGGAIETLTNLRKDNESLTELASIVGVVKKLDDLAEQKTDIALKITIDEKGIWRTKLLKSYFLFSDIQGEIKNLGFSCVNKQASIAYKADSVMEIPESWGSCVITVTAKPNTTFNFIQLQQKPS